MTPLLILLLIVAVCYCSYLLSRAETTTASSPPRDTTAASSPLPEGRPSLRGVPDCEKALVDVALAILSSPSCEAACVTGRPLHLWEDKKSFPGWGLCRIPYTYKLGTGYYIRTPSDGSIAILHEESGDLIERALNEWGVKQRGLARRREELRLQAVLAEARKALSREP